MAPTPYEHLAAHYDAIFRLNPALVAFLDRELDGLQDRRIVDAGCGTGTLARALADRGARVLAVDLDPALLARAVAKAVGPPPFRTQHADLRSFEAEPGLDAVLCLGNTLPHLPSEEDVAAFFRHARGLLAPGGALVLQLVNYDRILDQGLRQLPPLETPDLLFTRTYGPLPEGRLRFTTRLTSHRDGVTTASEQPLLPLRLAVVLGLLHAAGFGSLGTFGGFQGEPASDGDAARIVVARNGGDGAHS